MKLLAVLLLSAITAVSPVAADESAAEVFGVMYWTHRDEGVYRAARDGSEIKLLAAIKNADGDGKIFEINIADKQQSDILTGLVGPDELALDPANRQLYFTSSGQHKIERIGLDGSGRREIVGGLGTPFGLALDVDRNELYFLEAQGKLPRVKLDGSNLTTLAEGLSQPDGLAFDQDNRKLYWTEKGKLCQANAEARRSRRSSVARRGNMLRS